ncbi:VOC family protein, partial [Paenibacillus gansuensis]
MEICILRFFDENGKHQDAAKGSIPALFLIGSGAEGGRLGFTWPNGDRHAVGCFVTPCIQELFERFKENGVNIVGEIRQTCGPNLRFYDPDGNMWEIWQP